MPYELEIYHRQKTMLAPPELEKIHPLGKSPLVTVTPAGPPGGAEPFVLAESGFIIQYLCDHYGQGRDLVPRRWKEGQEGRVGGETEEWMRYQYILYYSEGSLMPYLWLTLVISALKGPGVPFFVRPITGMAANKIISMVVLPNIKRHYALLEQMLATAPGGGGKFICGEHLTAADIVLSYPLLAGKGRVQELGAWDKGTPQATYPRLFEYVARLEAETGWKKSADKIREIEGDFSVTPKASL